MRVFRKMNERQLKFMRSFLLLLKEEGREKSKLLSVVALQMQRKVYVLHYIFLKLIAKYANVKEQFTKPFLLRKLK